MTKSRLQYTAKQTNLTFPHKIQIVLESEGDDPTAHATFSN